MEHRGQTVTLGEIHPEPTEMIHDPLNGNVFGFWRITDFEGKDRTVMHADFDLVASRIETNVDPDSIEPYDTESKEYQRYTESEPWIELTDELGAKAVEITGDETNPYVRAKMLFDWVVANMDYEYPDIESRGAEKSFARLKGDCGEFSVVFQALCRSVGIPTRSVTCLWPSGGGHAWCEILVPPYGWIPADPSVAEGMTEGSESLGGKEGAKRFAEKRGIPEMDPNWLFGNLYPNRVMVFIGENVLVKSENTGIERTFRFMQPGGLTAYPPAVEVKGLSETTVHGGFVVFGDERDDTDAAMARAEMELAVSYLAAEMYDEAERGLLAKVEEKPEDAMSWLYLGDIYKDKDEYNKAIEAYEKSIAGKAGSIKPIIDVWARYGMGNCYDLKGERGLAVEEYQKVVDSEIDFMDVGDSARACLEKPFERIEGGEEE
jgi:tetratricopeptide (TPR) repeat protein